MNLRYGRKGLSAPLVGSLAVLMIIALAFGYYYSTTENSLASLSSQLSNNQSSLSSAVQAVSSGESSISTMAVRISSLSSELGVVECSATARENATVCVGSTSNSSPSQSANARLVNVSGSLDVPGGTGSGTLHVIVYNGLNESIVSISVDFGVLAAPYGPMPFNYSGSTLSRSNPLPFGMSAEGQSIVQGGTQGLFFGYGYSFNVKLTLGDGEVIAKQLYVQAAM